MQMHFKKCILLLNPLCKNKEIVKDLSRCTNKSGRL